MALGGEVFDPIVYRIFAGVNKRLVRLVGD
jgi:hypothetical protein